MILPKNNLERLQLNQLFELATFVVTENFKHHTNCVKPLGYENEINSIFKEELNYFNNSQIFVSRDFDKSIIGSIRVLRWNYLDTLPIQKIFNINPSLFIDENPQKPIWHIGRLAIRRGIRNINLFKQLMVCAIAPICDNENAVAFAECDTHLLRVLQAYEIHAKPIGKPVFYLGSETIPILMSYKGLINFYNKNLDIQPMGIRNKIESKNYTFG